MFIIEWRDQTCFVAKTEEMRMMNDFKKNIFLHNTLLLKIKEQKRYLNLLKNIIIPTLYQNILHKGLERQKSHCCIQQKQYFEN